MPFSFDGAHVRLQHQRAGRVGNDAPSALTLNTAGSNALTIAAPISSGSGGLTPGSGTVILTASNTFSGGPRSVPAPRCKSAGQVFWAGAIRYRSDLQQRHAGGQHQQQPDVQRGDLRQRYRYELGSGVTSLTGSNSYSGLTTVAAGTLQLGNTGGPGKHGRRVTSTAAAALDINGLNLVFAERARHLERRRAGRQRRHHQ